MRVLHLFNWKLKDIIPILKKVKEQGFEAIQINPLQPLKEENFNDWWMSYQPIGFRIGNQYGSQEELKGLCQESKELDLKIIADVVCNHMGGKEDGSLYPHDKVDQVLKDNPHFWKEPKYINDWNNRYEVINYCLGLPSLNLKNKELQLIILKFLKDLLNCGVEGFRFDAAKNIGLPNEDNYFWPLIREELKKDNIIIYGEIIFEREETIYEYCQYMDVLTENIHINSHKIFNFIESHDSYLEFQYTKSLSSNEINERYKNLVLNTDKTLYYARPFDEAWKDEKIKEVHYQKRKKYH